MATLTQPNAVYLWPGQTHFGAGVSARAGAEARSLGASQVFLLADPGVVPLAERVIESLEAAGVAHTLYSMVFPNPAVETVDAAADAYRQHECDCIIAVGGGSVIDTAKGVRMLANFPGASIFDFSYLQPAPRATPLSHQMPPMIAIPTAAGTGAEVTPWGVITHSESKRKFGIGGATVIPTVALVDPELTYGLPPGLTAATGADALSHLVEAFVSTNEAPMLDPLILHGIELIGRSLAAACANGHDATARADVMLGAMLGGVAISTRWLGACHALAHPLSGISGVPHGLANAIMLPHVVDFNRHAAAERYARVAVALDPTLAAAGPLQPPWPQADYAAAAIRRVIHSPEVLPTRLSDAGVSREQIPLLAAAALLDLNHTTNPRPCSEADLEALYEAAW